MNWDSASAFFAMGGHGFFVWGSYGLAAVLMLAEPFLAWHRHRQALRDAARQAEDIDDGT